MRKIITFFIFLISILLFSPINFAFHSTCSFCGDGSCGINYRSQDAYGACLSPQTETCSNCPSDCGACPFCGDGACGGSETCSNCPQDCAVINVGDPCGNCGKIDQCGNCFNSGVCAAGSQQCSGSNIQTCRSDCSGWDVTQKCDALDGSYCSGDTRQDRDYTCRAEECHCSFLCADPRDCCAVCIGVTCGFTVTSSQDCLTSGALYCDGTSVYRENLVCSDPLPPSSPSGPPGGGATCIDSPSGGTFIEDCLAKTTTETDGGSTDYTTPGSVADYDRCFLNRCVSTGYADVCSGSVLTEYGASGASFVSPTIDCSNSALETIYCSDEKLFRNEFDCKFDLIPYWQYVGNGQFQIAYYSSPGYCYDTTTNTLIEDCNTRDGSYCVDADSYEVRDYSCNDDSGSCDYLAALIDCPSDGWYCESGSTREYREYSCSGGSCNFITTQTPNNFGDACGCQGTVACSGACTGEITEGHNDFCTECRVCNDGEGDCDVNSECAGDLICIQVTGTDRCGCVDDFNDACGCQGTVACSGACTGEITEGHNDFCTVCRVCNNGEGDCDVNSECAGDLICIQVTGTDRCGCVDDFNDACGNCGTYDCSGVCVNQGVCSIGSTQCSGSTYQTCSSTCGWENSGTDDDGDGVDTLCGDSLCDNNPNFVDSNRQCDAGQTRCVNYKYQTCNSCAWENSGTDADGDDVDRECPEESIACDSSPFTSGICDIAVSGKCVAKTSSEFGLCEGLDNDCDGDVDEDCSCIDTAPPQSCGSNVGACEFGTQTCSGGNWGTCIDIGPTTETCDGVDNNCDGAIDEGCNCVGGTSQSCDSNVGACESGEQTCINNEWGACIDSVVPSIEVCTDGIDNDCDGFTDCADSDCAGQTGPGNVLCCQTAANCEQNDCVEEICSGNICSYTDRPACASDECAAGSFCDSLGGNCQTPDQSSNVCKSCVPDKTPGTWSWASKIFEDAGIEYGANLFDSDGSACPDSSCSTPGACACFDADGNPKDHKSALTNNACCGDDVNEFYKKDYHGPECTSTKFDCVWATSIGDYAQASNTGNIEYWCNLGKWHECTNAARDIGTKAGGVTCAGIDTSFEWTPNADVLEEKEYGGNACSDGFDNDGDGNIDEGCSCPEEGKTKPCGSNIGVCEKGLQTCTNAAWGTCDGNIEPTEEICDNIDNNCNGPIDEGCNDDSDNYCDASMTTIGTPSICLSGGGDCNDNDASVNPSATEVCDLIDNNCESSIDEGCPCSPDDITRPCGSDVGICTQGTQTCNLGTWSTCDGNIEPNPFEICDDLDNDCNGLTDDGCNDDNDNYCDASMSTSGTLLTCSAGGGDCNDNNFFVNPAITEHCTNFIDDNCNAKTDCQDPFCVGTISGNVKDVDNNPISGARIDILQGTTLIQPAFTVGNGDYTISWDPSKPDFSWDPTDPVFCGTFNIIASAENYLSSTKTDVVFPPKDTITESFTLILGSACEVDCTYAGDNTIHRECDGRNGCSFIISKTKNDKTVQDACNLAQPGWKRPFGKLFGGDDAEFDIICSCENDDCETNGIGILREKIITAAEVACEKENLIKITKVVVYKGEPVNLVITVCG